MYFPSTGIFGEVSKQFLFYLFHFSFFQGNKPLGTIGVFFLYVAYIPSMVQSSSPPFQKLQWTDSILNVCKSICMVLAFWYLVFPKLNLIPLLASGLESCSTPWTLASPGTRSNLMHGGARSFVCWWSESALVAKWLGQETFADWWRFSLVRMGPVAKRKENQTYWLYCWGIISYKRITMEKRWN